MKGVTILRLAIVLVLVMLLVGAAVGWNSVKAHFIEQAMAQNASVPQTVSTATAEYSEWQPQVEAVGSLRAIHGVEVTTEVAGLVRAIAFKSGSDAQSGQVLVQLNADPDMAQLRALMAEANLAALTYHRDLIQYQAQAIGRAQLDTDIANLKSAREQEAAQAALVAKKTIRAPFRGRLGITTVNPGQYLNPGDPIVTLESVDPIYVDFRLPEDNLASVAVGQTVHLGVDAFPGTNFQGKITSIDPLVDSSTRNFEAEATITQSRAQAVAGNVRPHHGRCGCDAALPHAAADSGDVQPVRRDRVPGAQARQSRRASDRGAGLRDSRPDTRRPGGHRQRARGRRRRREQRPDEDQEWIAARRQQQRAAAQ